MNGVRRRTGETRQQVTVNDTRLDRDTTGQHAPVRPTPLSTSALFPITN